VESQIPALSCLAIYFLGADSELVSELF